MKTLYEGIVQDWYVQRCTAMFVRRPCTTWKLSNHLLGECPTCGLGRYAQSTRFVLGKVVLSRIHIIYASKDATIQKLLFALNLYPSVLSNVEYPLPIVKYHNTMSRIPQYFDQGSRTVIDVFDNTDKHVKRAIQATIKAVCPHFNYKAFSINGDVLESVDVTTVADVVSQIKLLAAKL